MATMNPLEKKARTSFIKGLVIAGLIGVIVIAVLAMQIFKINGEEKKRLAGQKKVVVINTDAVSGELVTADMLTEMKVDASMAPVGVTTSADTFKGYFLSDIDGHPISTLVIGGSTTTEGKVIKVLTLPKDENSNNLFELQGVEGNYYIYKNKPLVEAGGDYTIPSYADQTREEDKERVRLSDTVLVAKIDLTKNTPVSLSMFDYDTEKTTDDLRQQEYNMIVLPSTLQDGDTLDIRLRLPSGADYIVMSKKRVTLADIGGTVSPSTILMNVSENEILTMSAAIVDAYKIAGSKLYATKYTDPGLQATATATYVPSNDTMTLIESDPNIVTTARTALINRYNSTYSTYRGGVSNALSATDAMTQQSAVESGTTTEITTQQSERKTYLDSMAGE